MDRTQLNELKSQHDALIRLTELMETDTHCPVNESRHSMSTVTFRHRTTDVPTEIKFIHNKDDSFEARISQGQLRLSDKSRNALEAMSSTMATVVKSVLNEELEEMKKAFSDIKIDGHQTTEIGER